MLYFSKISGYLNDIVILLSKPSEACDELVCEREERISAEFTKRFLRNNLYSIQLMVNFNF